MMNSFYDCFKYILLVNFFFVDTTRKPRAGEQDGRGMCIYLVISTQIYK